VFFDHAELSGLIQGLKSDGEVSSARARSAAIDRITTVYYMRMDHHRHDRAQSQLRTNYFFALMAVLGGNLLACAVAIKLRADQPLLIACLMGALGSILSGIYKLRDEELGIRQLRSIWPVLVIQPLVGAAAAMLVFAVLKTGIIQVATFDPAKESWPFFATFGFVAGFSEPFFLGVVRRTAVLTEQEKSQKGPPVLATFVIHTARGVSRRPSVVVMQAIEDWECHDRTVGLGHSRHRLFLPEALVWPSLVVEAGVLRDEAQKMALAKHEDMVEQFAPKSADKALGEGVHVRGPDRGANDLSADRFEQAREPSTQLGVAIDDKHFGLGV